MNAEKFEATVRELVHAALNHGVPFVTLIGLLDTVVFELNNALAIAKAQRMQAHPKLVVPRGVPFPPPPNGGQT